MLEITKGFCLFVLFCIWSGVMLQERPDKYISMGNWPKISSLVRVLEDTGGNNIRSNVKQD